MPETLTESFCERCGTRYAFEPPQKPRSLTKLRVLSRGLKSYVLTDGSSFGDVLTHARSDEESRRTNQQLDQFHDAFKFCMSCRQYTCGACWNAEAGQCLTCSPVAAVAAPPLLQVVETAPPAAMPDAPPAATPPIALSAAMAPPAPAPLASDAGPIGAIVEQRAPDVAVAGSPAHPELSIAPVLAEPSELPLHVELSAPPTPPHAPVSPLVPKWLPVTPIAAATASATEPEFIDLESRLDFGAQTERRATPVDRGAFSRSTLWARRIDGTTSTAHQEPSPLAGMTAEPTSPASAQVPEFASPTDSATAEIISPSEADLETARDIFAAEPEVVVAAEPEVVVAAEPVWWIVAPDGENQPGTDIAGQPTWAVPAHTPAARNGPIATRRPDLHLVRQPASPLAATARTPGPFDARPAPSQTNRAQAPVSATSAWPAIPPAALPPAPMTAANAQNHGAQGRIAAADAVWAASSRDVLNRPGSGAQACVSCGLALSAAARFCRRCGSSQA